MTDITGVREIKNGREVSYHRFDKEERDTPSARSAIAQATDKGREAIAKSHPAGPFNKQDYFPSSKVADPPRGLFGSRTDNPKQSPSLDPNLANKSQDNLQAIARDDWLADKQRGNTQGSVAKVIGSVGGVAMPNLGLLANLAGGAAGYTSGKARRSQLSKAEQSAYDEYYNTEEEAYKKHRNDLGDNLVQGAGVAFDIATAPLGNIFGIGRLGTSVYNDQDAINDTVKGWNNAQSEDYFTKQAQQWQQNRREDEAFRQAWGRNDQTAFLPEKPQPQGILPTLATTPYKKPKAKPDYGMADISKLWDF